MKHLLPLLFFFCCAFQINAQQGPPANGGQSGCYKSIRKKQEALLSKDSLAYYQALEMLRKDMELCASPEDLPEAERAVLIDYRRDLETQLMAYNARIAARMDKMEKENAALHEALAQQQQAFGRAINHVMIYHIEEQLKLAKQDGEKKSRHEVVKVLVKEALAQGVTKEAISAVLAAYMELADLKKLALATGLSARGALDESLSMVFVQGGTFVMGCTEEQGRECRSPEKPGHEVTVGDFYIGKYEVTVAQYMAFAEATQQHYPEWKEAGSSRNIETGSDRFYKKLGTAITNENSPIVGVSWEDAVAYCAWVSEQTGEQYRLPTEAEWEYVARGGKQAMGTRYAGSDNLADVAWFEGNSKSKMQAVGRKAPNALGIYDMSGNVMEWCSDWYAPDYYTRSASLNPQGPQRETDRTMRGGCWASEVNSCRVSHRDGNPPNSRNTYTGFRIVLVR